MTPQERQALEQQLAAAQQQLAGLQTMQTQAQNLGYKDTKTMQELGLSPDIQTDVSGNVVSPFQLEPQTEAEKLAEQEKQRRIDEYKAGPPDQNKINADVLAGFQSQIDSLNKVYAEEKAKIISQQRDIAMRQQGTQRAQLAGAGMLGQPSGSGMQEELKLENLRQENEAVGLLQAQYQLDLNEIFDKAKQDAKDIYADKQKAWQGTADEILAAPEKERQAKADAIARAVKRAIAKNMDWSQETSVKELAKALGVNPKDIVAEYTTQKSILEQAQKEQEQKAQKAQADLVTTFTGKDGASYSLNKATGELKQLTEAEKPETFSEPYLDSQGNLVQRNNKTGKVDVLNKAEAGTGVGGTGETKGDIYTKEKKDRILNSVNGLMGRVNKWTVGWGALSAGVPGSKALDFKSDLDTLKSNIATSELQDMRNASKTGGALGQVAVQELMLLEAALGALDQKQSPENFAKNLKQVKTSVENWYKAKEQEQGGISTGKANQADYDYINSLSEYLQ